MIGLAILVHPILLVEELGIFVSAQFNLLDFFGLPAIHLQRSREHG